MEGWSGYAISDFLLFDLETYWRLFSQQKGALGAWVALPIAVALLTVGLLLSTNANRLRIATACVALAWLGAAYFVFAYYKVINWAAGSFVWIFLAQAVLLAAASALCHGAFRANTDRMRTMPGIMLFALAALFYPVISLIADRPLAQSEIVGLSPDPTALATLGLLAMAGLNRVTFGLSLVPVIWCGLSAVALLALGTPQGWLLIAGILWWTCAMWIGRPRSRETDANE